MEADTLAKEASADQPMNEFTPSYNDLEVVEDKKMDYSCGWLVYTACRRNRSRVAIPKGR